MREGTCLELLKDEGFRSEMDSHAGQLSPDNGKPSGLGATWRGPATKKRQSPVNRVEKVPSGVGCRRWRSKMGNTGKVWALEEAHDGCQ